MKRLGLVCCVLAAASCSVINSFDEVDQEAEATGSGGRGAGGSEGSGGEDGSGGEGSGGEAAGGGTSAGGADAGPGAGGGSSGGATGGGGAGEAGPPFNPNVAEGVIVAYRAGPKDLAVVNVKTGTVVSTEAIGAVAGIANDGGPNVWYILEQGATPAADGSVHARRLDPKTGEWREVGTLTGRIPLPTSALGVLNQRLVYASDAGAGAFAFTMLDTSDPAAPRLVTGGARAPFPTGQVLGFLASPRSATLVGGSISVIVRNPTCSVRGDGGTVETCDIEAHSFVVDATTITVAAGSPRVVGEVAAGGQVGASQDTSTPRADVLAFPTLAATADLPMTCADSDASRTYRGSVQKFNPVDFTPVGSPVDFGVQSDRITGAAFDSCSNTLMLGTLTRDPGIHVVPLDPGGTPFHYCQGGGGTGLLFEPYERVLLRRKSVGDLEAYRLGGTRAAPTLQSAPAAIPANFAGTVLAVRAAPRCQ